MLAWWTAAAAGTALVALALAVPGGAAAQVGLEPVGTFADPVYVTSDPDDHDRLFVVERAGAIQLATPEGTSEFADLTSVVLANDQERGLLSLAFPPNHAETGLLYVAYTASPTGALQVAELESVGDTADPESLRPVISIPSPFANHNAGQLQFGPDGYLYVSTGDGGGGGDPQDHGQDVTTLLGGILRIDPRQAGEAPYSVPVGNPFADPGDRPVEGARPEIWSWGLRNPWRFSFDRESGALTIGDVGQGQREEINYRPQEVGGGRADNFGWDCREGLIAFTSSPSPACATSGPWVDPVFDYMNFNSPNCAITGGYVVRDSSLPELDGRYLYADYCVGQLRSIDLAQPQAGDRSEGLTVGLPSSFGEDACGRVYVASRSNGVVSRVVGETEADCEPGDPPPVDEDAPVTTLSIDGAPRETGYDGPVDVTLSASDLPEGEGASGVAYSEYRLSEGSHPGDWVRLMNDDEDDPFVSSFTVSPFAEQQALRRRSPVIFFYTLDYRSADRHGNVEEVRSVDFEITIGEAAPVLRLTANRRRLVAGPRARRVAVRARLANLGAAATGPVRLCAKAPPRRLRVRGPRCTTEPALGPGEARTRRVVLRVRRPARGKLSRVRLTASGNGFPALRTVVRVRARR